MALLGTPTPTYLLNLYSIGDRTINHQEYGYAHLRRLLPVILVKTARNA